MIKLESISKEYNLYRSKKVMALSDVSLSFPERGLVFITGPKDFWELSLINILAGLERPSAGKMIVDGRDTSTFAERDWEDYRNACVGVLFRDPHLRADLDVGQNVALSLGLRKRESRKEREKKVEKALSLAGREGDMKRRASALSEEGKRRVALATTLVKDPSILVLDEPADALEESSKNALLETFKALSKERLVIIVTGDASLAEHYADWVVEMKDGKVFRSTLPSAGKEESPAPLNKSNGGMGFSRILRNGGRYLLRRPVGFLLATALSALSVTLFGLAESALPFYQGKTLAQELAANPYDFLSLRLRHSPSFHDLGTLANDEEAKRLEDETGLNALAKTVYLSKFSLQDSTPYRNASVPSELEALGKDFYFSEERGGYLLGAQDASSFPSSYHLLSGHYPENADEILLTDFQYEALKAFGYSYEFQDVSVSLSGDELADPSKLLGKPIYMKGLPDLSVCGVLKTSYDAKTYEPYKNYLMGGGDPEKLPSALSDLATRFQDQKQWGYWDVVIAHPAYMRTYVTQAYEFYNADPKFQWYAEPKESTPPRTDVSRIFRDGMWAYEGNRTSYAYFDGGSSLSEGEVLVEPRSYFYSLGFYWDRTYVIPKRFLYGASEDLEVTMKPGDFFDSLTDRAEEYITSERYKEAFDGRKFDVDSYVRSYYEKKGEDVPSSIPDEEKKAIFRTYVDSCDYRRPDWDDPYGMEIGVEVEKKGGEMLTYFVRETDFTVRQVYQSPVNGEPETRYVIAGLALGWGSVGSKTIVAGVSSEYGRHYPRLLAPKPATAGELNALTGLFFKTRNGMKASNGMTYRLGIDGYQKWVNVAEGRGADGISSYDVGFYGELFISLSIVGIALSAVLMEVSFSRAFRKSKREIGTLWASGARRRDIFLSFLSDAVLIFVLSFAAALPAICYGINCINAGVLAAYGVSGALRVDGLAIFLTILVSALTALLGSGYFLYRLPSRIPLGALERD